MYSGGENPPSLATGFESAITKKTEKFESVCALTRLGIKGMGNIRHKWMVLVVVAVTTFATAREAVKQYDGLREQANEWATSRLLTSLLNTSAPVEELIETQTVSSSSTICAVEERSDEQPVRRQLATLTTRQSIKTKSNVAPQLEEVMHVAVNETPAQLDRQHFELSDADRKSLERLNDVALLTEKNQFAGLEALGELEETQEPENERDDHAEDDSIAHTQAAIHFVNRVLAEVPARMSETNIKAVRARAEADALVQQRAATRALRVLQERTERRVKFELKIIKKGDRTSGTATPIRAANSGRPVVVAADNAECALPVQPALQDIAGTSPNSELVSE